MEKIELQRILLKTAVLAMTADGKIHEDELNEINKIAESQNYFTDINYKQEVKELIEKANSDFRIVYKEYFEIFENNYLSIVEILLIFEILLKIVNADLQITEEEKNFVKFLRRKFSYVPNDIFLARFGSNDLFVIENNIVPFESKKIDLSNINLNDYLGEEIR
jgi:uncharacterized tellurite resistance protein B-like protein